MIRPVKTTTTRKEIKIKKQINLPNKKQIIIKGRGEGEHLRIPKRQQILLFLLKQLKTFSI